MGEDKVHQALRDVAIVLLPMLLVLMVVVMLPQMSLALPKLLMPKFV